MWILRIKQVLYKNHTHRAVFSTHVYLVEVELDGFNTVKFTLQNMVLDTTRFEQYPGFSSASQCANGKLYSVIPGLDTIYKDSPVMLFDDKRICTTVYLPGEHVMNSTHEGLINDINTILYNIFCEGKLAMTNAAKMSSGPLDIPLFCSTHAAESKYFFFHFFPCSRLFTFV